jgi:transposase
MDPARVQRLHNEPAMAIGHRKELREDPSMKVTRIGLDIAKQIFELHGVDRRGRVVVRKKLRRERVLEYFSQLPACEVALEACGGAHYWQRAIGKLGHTVRLFADQQGQALSRRQQEQRP